MNYQETKQRLERHQGIGLAFVVAWCGQIVACMALGLWTFVGAGIVGLAVCMAKVCAISFELHKEDNHGLHRRADPQVHGDTSDGADDGAVTVTWTASGGTAGPFTVIYSDWGAKPKRTVERTGIRLGEVEGYRAWAICGPLLFSMNGMPWLPDRAMEGKELDEHNGRGVHAWKDFVEACRYASDTTWPMAIGKVKLWGEIIEHERGYRGEFARPSQIMTIVGIPDLAVTESIIGQLPFAISNVELERIVRSQVDALYGLEPYQEPTAEAA